MEGDTFLSAFDVSPQQLPRGEILFLLIEEVDGVTCQKKTRALHSHSLKEVTENGLWRQQAWIRHATQYLEWTFLDRIALTLFCM
jgi:hypothetical protein